MATVNPLGTLAGPASRARGAPVRIGIAGGTLRADVDGAHTVAPVDAGWALEWWVGADDRWHVPRDEAAVRQRRLGGAPVVETSMRVPGGDAVARTFGVGGDPEGMLVEIENASAAPFALALVLRPTPAGSLARVAVDGPSVGIGGGYRLLAPRPPMRWAAGRAGTSDLRDVVERGEASADAFGGRTGRVDDPDGRLEVALLFPVAHRTTFRCLLTADRSGGVDGPAGPRPDGASGVPSRRLAAMPSAADAARGWSSLLDRGMRAALPDDRVSGLLAAARAAVLLDPSADAAAMAVLEDWGFDAEAADVWARLGIRSRRAARRRPPPPPAPEAALAATVAAASSAGTWAAGPVPFLRALRDVLVADRRGEDAVDVLPALPAGWVGEGIEVHDAPTRAGRLSYAVRWHGGHPLLLWELTADDGIRRSPVTLRAPSLDPSWSTVEAAGDALLGHHHDHDHDDGDDHGDGHGDGHDHGDGHGDGDGNGHGTGPEPG